MIVFPMVITGPGMIDHALPVEKLATDRLPPPHIAVPIPIVFPCVVIKLFVAFSAALRPGFMPRWINVARRGECLCGKHHRHRQHRGVNLVPFPPGLSYGPSRSVSVRYHRFAGAVTMATWGFVIGLRYRGSALFPRLANRRTPISCWRRRACLSLCFPFPPPF